MARIKTPLDVPLPSDSDEISPPIVPGVTSLSPERARAVFGAGTMGAGQGQGTESPQELLSKIGESAQKLAEMDPKMLDSAISILNAIKQAMEQQGAPAGQTASILARPPAVQGATPPGTLAPPPPGYRFGQSPEGPPM